MPREIGNGIPGKEGRAKMVRESLSIRAALSSLLDLKREGIEDGTVSLRDRLSG
jgi:hypothetical protein